MPVRINVANRLAASAAIALLVALNGYATLSPDECLHADWRTIGYEDGIQGRDLSILSQHRQACAEVGVAPDLDAYQAGRADGVRVFCRPPNAYEQGRQGHAYSGVCPADMEQEFIAAHGEGMAIFDLESTVAVASQIASIDYNIEDAERRINQARNTLENEELTRERRLALGDDIKVLLRDIGRLEAERGQLMIELGVREERLRTHVRMLLTTTDRATSGG